MTQDKMPDEIFARPPDKGFGQYGKFEFYEGYFCKYIRHDLATLATKRLTDEEVEGLKKAMRHSSVGGTPGQNQRAKGWNDCIDHLRERGII